jgi:DNA end-binding protein Ku
VELTRGELEAFDPQGSRTIDLQDFVELADIDPIFFDTTYHLMPGEGAQRPYATLALALRASGRVGIGRWVMHLKEHLCAVWPHERGLVLSTLHFADELLPQESFSEFSGAVPPVQREVESVLDIIETRTVDFVPQRYHDLHRERLLAFLERRARTHGLREVPAEAPAPTVEEVPRATRAGSEVRELPLRGSLRLRQQAAREVRERAPRGKRVEGAATPRTRRGKGDPAPRRKP